ncbi:MAG: universal stress protein [Acidimicrobiales bacterium]
MSPENQPKHRVVVGVDGSPGGDEALRWAVGEANHRNAVLEVTCCWLYPAPVGPGAFFVHVHGFPDLARAICEKAEAEARALDPGLLVDVRTPELQPQLGLVEASRGADLLITGARGLGAFRSLLLGSVSQHCAHQAHGPVMIVRPPHLSEPPVDDLIPRVVVGVDGSPDSARALQWAVEEAFRLEARLEVVGAWPPLEAGGLPLIDLQAALDEYAHTALDNAVQVAAAVRPEVEVTTTISTEAASWALVKASEQAQLLVVGSRGLGGFKSMLLGSVSQHCATHGACSTLIVREAP